ncbi:hypothetical protein [Marinoscillum sp.]|uniref:hypothetical protein n=1 Tax=Marinoscillum sp. TaxID=2024838 RepID=UPI003BAB21EF
MTLLRVHDFQQELVFQFIQKAKATLELQKSENEKRQMIFLQGQELGFCNDEIEVLLEDVK